MNKKQKTALDRKTIRDYENKLRARRKEYSQYAQTYSETGRRARALAAGEMMLQLTEQLKDLAHKKHLLEGSLSWTFNEQKVKDTDGKKGFHYLAAWGVNSDEPYYTEEEIRKELNETYRKIREETDEMFSEEPEDPLEET